MPIRADSAGGTHAFVQWLHRRRLGCSVGFTLPDDTAELTGLMDLSGWPPGIRVIARKERPHPGAQLRITDVDGNRITAFATNTPRGLYPRNVNAVCS